MLYLAGVLALGLALGRSSRNATDFLVAGRDLPWLAVLLSIVATETSTVTFLSLPGLAFAGDLTFLQLSLGYIVGRIAVSRWLLPAYFRGNTITAYEVLGLRFGRSTQQVVSLLFLVTRTLADGLRLYLAAVVLEILTGWDLWACVAAVGGATVLYTVGGGMRAVVWADCIQFVIYMAGAVLALCVICEGLPEGFAGVWQLAQEEGKSRIFDLSLSFTRPYVLVGGVIGGALLTLGTHGTDQLMVQRYLCARGPRPASLALITSGFVVALQFALFLFLGLALYSFFLRQPAGPEAPDRAFATFLVKHLVEPPGARGVLLGSVFAVTMSTLSSSLHASAATAVRDLFPASGSDRAELRRARLFAASFGVLQMLVACGGAQLADSVVGAVLAIAGFTTGIVLGVFILGRWLAVTATDALVGMAVGLVLTGSVCFATPLAWTWYAGVGALTTVTGGWLAGRLRAR